jgi:predicted DNA-binding protein
MPSKETLQIRLPKEEKDMLNLYCKKHGRTQTDVIRELIRGLQV